MQLPPVLEPLKNFPTFNGEKKFLVAIDGTFIEIVGTQSFITVFTTALHHSLF
jgi:hypothetical protein